MDGRRPRGMMFAPSGADPALPVGGSLMSGGPWMARSESSNQTVMPGHGWPAPEGDDVRAQRSRSGFAGRREPHERRAMDGPERIIKSDRHARPWMAGARGG